VIYARICFLLSISTMVLTQSSPVTLVHQSLASVPNGFSPPNPATQTKIIEGYGKLPLTFEANQGQTDVRVKFLSRGAGYTLFLTNDEAVFALRRDEANSDSSAIVRQHRPSSAVPEANAILRVKLVKTNRTAKVTGADELPGKSNYFIGNDPKKWSSKVPTHAKVKYEGVYSGIDLIYYGNQQQLEYDFVVAPGADPRRIKLDVHGAKKIRRENDGGLVLHMAKGELHWHKPLVYQEKNGRKERIDGQYVIKGGFRVGFELADYDLNRPLILDPGITYSTYLGGSGSDSGNSVAVDSAGNAYVTGSTSSIDFPIAPGGLQTVCGGACTNDAFISKLDPTGSVLVYSTYLGGSGTDSGNGIAVDGSGNVYVDGYTYSTDFPTTPGAFQTACGGGCSGNTFDAFITKLDASGSALVYSTYLGGSGNDYGASNSIAVDSSGNVYVTGATYSTDFPTTPGAFQTACGGGCSTADVFISKLNPSGSALVYSTYLGGSGYDVGQGIAIDSSGNAYVSGGTYSTDFPTMNPLQSMSGGNEDAFVAKLNPTGSALVYSTYLGGDEQDGGTGIAVDNSGDVYVTGFALSSNFPTTPGAFQTACGADSAFVTELNVAGSTFIYSTCLGTNGFASAIALDSSGDAYVTGGTGAPFPLVNPLQPKYGGGGYDAFVSMLNAAGSALVFSTYWGGSGYDFGYSIAMDQSNNIYVVGPTQSTDFPTVNPMQPAFAGGAYDAFVVKFLLAPAVTLSPPNLSFGNQAVGITTSPQISTLMNTGSVPLIISSIAVSGPNYSDFAQNNNCGTSVPVGASCTINVTFTPSVIGSESASISISDNAPNSPQSLPLAGVGTPPIVTFSPPSLTYGPQPVGTTSLPKTVTVTASGALSINSITTSAEFAQNNNCGSGIPVSGSCQINVMFTPIAPGLQNGTLMITDSGAGSPQSVPLSGTGTQPAVTLSPPSMNFGNQTLGITSTQQVSALTNTGSGTLTIMSIRTTGANKGNFAESNNCPTSLAAGNSCSITVTFTPSSTGTRTAAVSIADNAPSSPQSLPLSGVGVLPAVKFSTTSLTFPTQVVFTTSKTKTITLTNTGLGILNLASIATTGPFAQTNTCGTTVNPGASCTISVTFSPTTIGTLAGAVSLTDNAPHSPQQVTLSGTGTYVQLTPTSVNFGNQPVGTTSLAKKITLSNKGDVAVNITGISFTGTNASDFAETKNTCGTSVAAGASCFIGVSFTPAATGTRSAQVAVSDNGGGSPQTVGLTGTGTP
jgi:Beta-propeller repeat/Abnormal spindle-like microcephaly-assoc'd, ASPM-SPD-2-Hydin